MSKPLDNTLIADVYLEVKSGASKELAAQEWDISLATVDKILIGVGGFLNDLDTGDVIKYKDMVDGVGYGTVAIVDRDDFSFPARINGHWIHLSDLLEGLPAIYDEDQGEIEVGSRVVISKDSDFYGEDDFSNPTDCEGVVDRISKSSFINLPVMVTWDNGAINAYAISDLKLANEVDEEDEDDVMYTFVAPQDSITIVRIDPENGIEKRNINRGHMEFDNIRRMITLDQSKPTLAEAFKLMSVRECLEAFAVGRIKIDPDKETVSFVRPDGSTREAPQELTDDLIETVRTYGQESSKKLARFLDKLMDNPSFTSIESLYRFLKNICVEIREDGSILGWKGVRHNLYDQRSGSIFNGNFGEEIRVDRSEVDDNIDHTCSYGLHVGSKEYATGWGETVIAVSVEPQDVVAVPKDYNGAKMRCCAYTPLYQA